MDKLLCIDCLIEDHKEIPAVTVSNGFALCHIHLFKFYSKMYRAMGKQIDERTDAHEELKGYLDWEATVDRTKSHSS